MAQFRSALTPRLAGILGLLFFGFLLFIIVAADAGRMPPLIRALHDFPQGDRIGHVVLFAVLVFLLVTACPRVVRLGRIQLPGMTLAVLLFAVTEELSQSLFSTRTLDPVDLLCSVAGIFTGTWIACRFTAPAPRELHCAATRKRTEY